MSKNCDNRNPLQRDGTSQGQRLLKALLPEYVAVDERKIEDLIDFSRRYATEINYYQLNNNNTPNGTWEDFLTKTLSADQRNEPHYALFIAFLEMFRIAQEDLNTLTKRHLDFYYKEVLKLKEKEAEADQVFIVFELAEQLSGSLVKAGTVLDAGKDPLGVDLIYKTERDIVVNHGQVTQLKALFYNKNAVAPSTKYKNRLFASPIAKSSDGIGGALEGDEKRWRIFGRVNDTDLTLRPAADTGFAIASPMLFLAEGTRTVTVEIPNLDNTQLKAFSLSHANVGLLNTLKLYFTGEDGWMEPETFTQAKVIGSTLQIICTISAGQKAVVARDPEKHPEPYDTSWPIMRIVLNTADPDANNFYDIYRNLAVSQLKLTVDVRGIKNLVLQSDEGILATDKPFQPFGTRPFKGSSFYIGSHEIFQKELTDISMHIDWHGLPQSGSFKEHYAGYMIPAADRKAFYPFAPDNSAFTVNMEILHGKEWSKVDETLNLFNASSIASTHVLTPTPAGKNALRKPRDPYMEETAEFHALTKKGFIRLNLGATIQDVAEVPHDLAVSFAVANVNLNQTFEVAHAGGFSVIPGTPGYTKSADPNLNNEAFGHHLYQNSYAQQALWKAAPSTKPTLPDTLIQTLPNEPYTPTIKELTVDYVASQTIDLSTGTKVAYDKRVDQYFHVESFGVAERHPYIMKRSSAVTIVPKFEDDGTLYIGVDNLEPPSTLSLLFKVAEGSANPDRENEDVIWSYLYNNEWYKFVDKQILFDSTNGLLTSGIVSFDLPRAYNSDNTLFPAGTFWLKAAVAGYADAVCDLIDVQAQAVTAEFVDQKNDPQHLATALPAKTISSLTVSDAAITTVAQPYSSYGGHLKEASEHFYMRVSERLRHKDRSINIWDYEHIVLDKFPGIYKAKCLNHTDYTAGKPIREIAPGHVSLVVIPDLRNRNACNLLQPKASLRTLAEIHDHVSKLNPPCVTLHVRNPIFEEAQAEFDVRFLPGYDRGFYMNQLNEDIRQFLSPWAYGSTAEITFGGKLHKSTLINFVEERVYVDFVSCFKLNHLLPDGTKIADIEAVEVISSASVITSAVQHLIHVMEEEDCNCPGNELRNTHLKADVQTTCDETVLTDAGDGIGHDRIQGDFIVGRIRDAGIDFWQIENDFDVQ